MSKKSKKSKLTKKQMQAPNQSSVSNSGTLERELGKRLLGVLVKSFDNNETSAKEYLDSFITALGNTENPKSYVDCICGDNGALRQNVKDLTKIRLDEEIKERLDAIAADPEQVKSLSVYATIHGIIANEDNTLKQDRDKLEEDKRKLENEILPPLREEKRQIDYLKEKESGLKKAVDILEQKEKNKTAALAELVTKEQILAKKETALDEREKEIQLSEQRNKKTAADIKLVSDSINSAVAACTSWQQFYVDNLEKISKCDDLERRYNNLVSEKDNLQQKYGKLEQEHNECLNAEKVLESIEKREVIKKLEIEKAGLETEKNLLTNQLSAQKEEVSRLQSRNEEYSSQLSQLNTKLADYQNTEREVDNLKLQYDYLMQTNEGMKKLLEREQKAECRNLSAIDDSIGQETNDYKGGSINTTAFSSLNEVVEHIYDFARSDKNLGPLYYEKDDIAGFIAGLGIGRMTILQGTSGVGKTSLPKIIGRALHLPGFTEKDVNFPNIIAVGSSWRDRDEMFGYYNDFSRKFNAKEFTCAVYKANYYQQYPYFIVLDEMNLSRVEYYFADFLSKIDDFAEGNGITIPLFNQGSESVGIGQWPKYLEQGILQVPNNIYFIGTANLDASTFEITDKVYDRANVLTFNQIPQQTPLDEIIQPRKLTVSDWQRFFNPYREMETLPETVKEIYDETEKTLEKLKIFVGFRMQKQLAKFVPIFQACLGNNNDDTALQAADLFIANKILRKIEYKEGSSEVKDDFKKLQNQYTEQGMLRCAVIVEDWLKKNFPNSENNA